MPATSKAGSRYRGWLMAVILAGAIPLAALPLGVPPHAQTGRPPAAKKPAPKKKDAHKPVAQQPATPAQPVDTTAQPAAAPAGNTSASIGLGAGSGPTVIDADDGIEMQQSNKVYIAHGNAVVKRADRTLYGDTLMAFYRDIPNSDQTEVWRVVADGHVRLTTPTQSVEGDHGVYDLDTKTAIFTGKHLKLTTPQDYVTAKDTLEWYDDKQFAVARGDAVGVRADRRIRADILTAQVSQSPGQASRVSIVNGYGHVIASRPDEIGTGDKGVYNVDTGVVTLDGHVTLARGENTMRGEYGVLDMQKGESRLLPRLPTAADPTRGRVEGYMVPKKKDAKPGAPAAATPTPSAKVAPAPTPALSESAGPAQEGEANAASTR